MDYSTVPGVAEKNSTVQGCPPVAEGPPSTQFSIPQNQMENNPLSYCWTMS